MDKKDEIGTEKEVFFTFIVSICPCSIRKERINIGVISISSKKKKAHLVYGENYSIRMIMAFEDNHEKLYRSCIDILKKDIENYNNQIEKVGVKEVIKAINKRAKIDTNSFLKIDSSQISIEKEYSSIEKYEKYCDFKNRIVVWEE